ncbi:MAG: Lpp/OprI family alanine-zipper lipoprotein [Parvibaculum sp.]|nr:Lpp/OprI family alanine-zipper lipoprotein [Parvibaculum sp.]
MKSLKHIVLPAILVGATLLGGCATKLDAADAARLNQAVQDAADAKQIAQEALAASQAATQSANKAAESAQAANEKADRIFQRSLRK